MHPILKTATEWDDNPVLSALSIHFDGATGPPLFSTVFLWFYNQPHSREPSVSEAAKHAFVIYEHDGVLPDFFEVCFVLLRARSWFTEADCTPYSRGSSPAFWRYVFVEHFGEEPKDDKAELLKNPRRPHNGDTDSRWDELFKIGIPLYQKLDQQSKK